MEEVGPHGHPTLKKRLAIPGHGRTTCTGLWPQHATLRVWKCATEEGARWGTLKASLERGSRVRARIEPRRRTCICE